MSDSQKVWIELIGELGIDVVIYAVLAALCVWIVWRFTSKKLYRRLAVVFVILLPTWDVVLGSIFIHTACPFVPKAVIYETAETDGIYYEAKYYDTVMVMKDRLGNEFSITGSELDFKKGYQYWEVLAKTVIRDGRIRNKKPLAHPVVYRCTALPKSPRPIQNYGYQCSPVEDIRSGYLVKLEVIKIGHAEMNLLKIYNRSTGALMAEYRDLIDRQYRGWAWGPLPFFNWLGYKGNTNHFGGSHCPEKLRFLDFQYDVLKVKNKGGGGI